MGALGKGYGLTLFGTLLELLTLKVPKTLKNSYKQVPRKVPKNQIISTSFQKKSAAQNHVSRHGLDAPAWRNVREQLEMSRAPKSFSQRSSTPNKDTTQARLQVVGPTRAMLIPFTIGLCCRRRPQAVSGGLGRARLGIN